MPKSGAMNIVERHLEKLVLAICGVALAAAWVISSPKNIDLPGATGDGKIRPSQVDQRVLDIARATQRQVEAKQASPSPDNGQPGSPSSRDYVAEIRSLQDNAVSGLAGMVPFGSPAEWIRIHKGPELAKVSLTDLIQAMPRPHKPVVNAVRELPNRPMDRPADVLAAHVVSIYPWGELINAWKERLRKSGVPCRLAAVAIVAQAQEQQPDGTWGQPRDVSTVSVTIDQQGVSTATLQVPEIPPYDGTNLGMISQVRALIADPNTGWQNHILEPSYWQIWWPGYGWVDWLVNLPENKVTKEAAEAAQATEGGLAGGPGTVQPSYGPPRPTLVSPTLRRPGYSSVDSTEGAFSDYEAPDIEERGRFAPMPSRYPGATPTPTGTTTEEIPAPQQPVVPDIRQQMTNGNVLVWFHDDSLQSTKVYRYRLAIKFLNPLLGFDNVVEEPAFAAAPSITSQFSDWSDPVEVPKPTEFFLTGSMESQGRVTVTVFTRSTGQQVKKQFTVVPGQAIGEIKEIQLTNPADGTVSKIPVSFATGAIAVEVNFDRVDALGRKAVEMLYLDEKGVLRTKADVNSLSRNDKEYARFRDLEAKEKITRLAAEAAKAALAPPAPSGL